MNLTSRIHCYEIAHQYHNFHDFQFLLSLPCVDHSVIMLLTTLQAALNRLPDLPKPPPQPLELTLPPRTNFTTDLQRDINALAVKKVLAQRRNQLLTLDEGDVLWDKLSLGLADRDINFVEFKQIRDGVEKFKKLFKASVFLQLAKHSGVMSVVVFFNYVIKYRMIIHCIV